MTGNITKFPLNNNFELHPYQFAPKVEPDNIPDFIKNHKYKWCVWKAVPKANGKGFDKIPCKLVTISNNIINLKTAIPPSDENDADALKLYKRKINKWLTYDEALRQYQEEKDEDGNYIFNGIGVLVHTDMAIVDIDKTTKLGQFENINTYVEYSPSGAGLRIIGKSSGLNAEITNRNNK